jgi:hypothetical protein
MLRSKESYSFQRPLGFLFSQGSQLTIGFIYDFLRISGVDSSLKVIEYSCQWYARDVVGHERDSTLQVSVDRNTKSAPFIGPPERDSKFHQA